MWPGATRTSCDGLGLSISSWRHGSGSDPLARIEELTQLAIFAVMEPSLPTWIQYVEAIGPTAVAGAVAYVAWRQWRNDRWRLREALWERRYRVYKAVMASIGAAMANGDFTRDDQIDYLNGIKETLWLFDDEVSTFLEETLWRTLLEVHSTHVGGAASADAHAARMDDLRDQYDQLRMMMKPFLRLRS